MDRDSADTGFNLNSIHVELATRFEQYVEIHMLRALCWCGDKSLEEELGKTKGHSPMPCLPFKMAFDGNDMQATHVIAYALDEPIGACRIRWFADFAKIERTGFRRDYRKPAYTQKMADFVFSHIARKGYSTVLTHGSPIYARMWRMALGFKSVDKPSAQYLSKPFVEIVKHLDVPENAIGPASGVDILFRTEGAWDVPSPYEETPSR